MSRIYYGAKFEVVSALKNQNPNTTIVLVQDSIQQLKSYSRFIDADKIFLHDNPDNDCIKAIQNQLEKNLGIHYLFFDDDNFDGRLSLVQKIKKENNIFDFSYPVFGDSNLLRRKISNYIQLQDYQLHNSCFDWIIKYCPSFKIKSKATKKEKICYDLDLLFRELDKIGSVNLTILPEHLEDSIFTTEEDIFIFLSYLFEKQSAPAFMVFDNLISNLGEQALLLITLSQLLFLLSVSNCKEQNIFDSDSIVKHTELRDLLGKYLGDDWQDTKYTVKPQNPIRIKIELGKQTPSTKSISKMIQFTIDSIVSTRNNKDIYLTMDMWLNKMLTV